MIQLIKGSIFDSKCDLLVIPCNNMGGVTPQVYKGLIANELPYFHKNIKAGDVYFIENTGKFTNTSVVAYAASVNAIANTSKSNYIERIVSQIKFYCQNQSLRKVNIPLLGTGAGGLSENTSYSIMKTAFQDNTQIQLCVYAFSEKSYEVLAEMNSNLAESPIKNPRVFISYTGTDAVNKQWVKELACSLRENGVDARIDMFHLRPGQDLPQWMTNEVLMADKVLIICDKYYAEKADNRKGGVGWETMIIQGDMLAHQEQNKYAAILRDSDIDHCLPIFVKSKYALNWAKDDKRDQEFNDLLFYLFDCDTNPPPVGPIPAIIKGRINKPRN